MSSPSERTSTARASTSSSSAVDRRGWRPPSTRRPRVSARWWSNASPRAVRRVPALVLRTTSAFPPGSPARSSVDGRRSRRASSAPSSPASTRHLRCPSRSRGAYGEVLLADGQRVRGRSVVLASGADYRRLPAEHADRSRGARPDYAATHIEAQQCSTEDVVVVGGGNSAGQAVVKLADHQPGPHRRAAPARVGDVALPGRSNRSQVERSRLVRVRSSALEGDEKLKAVVISGAGPRSPRRDHGRLRR